MGRGGIHRNITKMFFFLLLTLAVLWKWHVTAVVLQLISWLTSPPCSERALWLSSPCMPHTAKCLQKALSALQVTPQLFGHSVTKKNKQKKPQTVCRHLLFTLFQVPFSSFVNPPRMIIIWSLSSLSFSSCRYIPFLCPWIFPSRRNIHLEAENADPVEFRWQCETADYFGRCEDDRDVAEGLS